MRAGGPMLPHTAALMSCVGLVLFPAPSVVLPLWRPVATRTPGMKVMLWAQRLSPARAQQQLKALQQCKAELNPPFC